MAIGLAKPKYVSRSSGGNACCKSAYNARSKIIDSKTGEVFNWVKRDGNVFHEIMLPEHVDKKFKDISVFSNEVERAENRKDSQLYVEWILALAKDEDGVDLEFRIETVKEFIKRKGWVEEGLGVQVDIHRPHEGDVNWHAHLLVTTRRFAKDGKGLDIKKARDLQPVIINGMVQNIEELQDSLLMREIQNEQFKARGMSNRVDLPGELTQEHIGPVRMRNIFNEAAQRNEERREAEIEHLDSGVRVLEKVTKHMSVFARGDLSRAVKYIPDREVREGLVEEAISDKSIIPLYTEEGTKTKYFTTTDVRDEENKILRLSGYVANLENSMSVGGKITRIANELVASSADGLTDEQHKALNAVLVGNSGLRVLRGRAGAGKSYVLGRAHKVATMSGVNVIGLAPTHKAKLGLAECGYERVDTVKGMLFKLANGRFDLPKHSLLVVDEAGMIANDDYKELLRVAATRKCNVVLAGDERQLASVSRGGMFEVFAEKYGSSTILDIQRQSGQWGKSVAMSMSEGRVESAISILESENRIKWDENSHASMESLIKDWNKSEYNVGDRLILAVKNSDVAAINHGVRQYLKLSGDLKGEEFAVAGNHYMQGDRVLITKTNKELGLVNGDLAEITAVSGDKFTIKLEGNSVTGSGEGEADYREISFNPSEYSGFRHGYATTVFKAQGASIKDVFVYHNGFAGIRNSYVALSRMVEELKLYVNKESTVNVNSLISQLSRDAEAGSSLSYLTESELKSKELSNTLENDSRAYVRGINRFIDFVGNTATKLADKYIPSSEYYNYKEPTGRYESVEKVIDKTYSEVENQNVLEEKLVVGGNSHNISHGQEAGKAEISQVGHDILNSLTQKNSGSENSTISTMGSSNNWKSKESSKTRFYRNADRMKAIKHYAAQKEEWAREYEQLKSEVKFKAEYIARDLLGEPNKKLSNGRNLRYGEHGKIIVCITGEKAGTWYDFSRSEGGDMFALVQEKQGYDFKQASDYLRSSVGMSVSSSTRAGLKLVDNHREKDRLESIAKDRREQEKQDKAKAVYVDKLQGRAKDIGDRSVAHRYLSKTRGINVDLGDSIKTAGIYDRQDKLYRPALVAFAKDAKGRVTGGQQILLDRKTNSKADIAVPKKSFGKIAGSFVDLGGSINDKSNVGQAKADQSITIIAEGVETGLSIKQSMREHSNIKNIISGTKTLCSLGISNIKNYQPKLGEKIIIAADNDGKSSNTAKTIESAKLALEGKGAFVEIVRPEIEGDFNDILQDKQNGGTREIAKVFSGAIAKHSAVTLDAYFSSHDLSTKLDEVDKSNLEIIQKHNVSEQTIVDAYRKGDIYGKIELDKTRKNFEAEQSKLNIAKGFAADNKAVIDEAKRFGYAVDNSETIRSLVGMDMRASAKHIQDIRNDAVEDYFNANLKNFADKQRTIVFEGQKELISKEQTFLKEAYELSDAKDRCFDYGNSRHLLYSGKSLSENPEKLDEFFKQCQTIKDNNIMSDYDVAKLMVFSQNIGTLLQEAAMTIEIYNLKTIPEDLAQIRSKAESIEGVFATIEKEQNHLANQHGNIEHLDFEKEELSKCEVAYRQREDNSLDDLKDIANQALTSGAKSKEELLVDLQQVTDLQAGHTKLDKDIESHNISSTLNRFKDAKQSAKTVDTMLGIINKEQKFLSSLHGNIKYPEDQSKALIDKCALAHKQQEGNNLDDLKDIANQALTSGAKSQKELLIDLQQITDLKASHTKLDKDIENHHISSTLNEFKDAKQSARTVDSMLGIINKEQKFLSELHGNIKYPEDQSNALINKCALAHKQIKDNSFDNLNKALNTIGKTNFADQNTVFNIVKKSSDPAEAHKNLITAYHDHFMGRVHKGLHHIEESGRIKFDNQEFHCPLKLVQHITDTHNHEYAPHKEMQQLHNKIQEQHKAAEMHKELELSM